MPLFIAQYDSQSKLTAEIPFPYNPIQGATVTDSLCLLGFTYPNVTYHSAIAKLPTGHENLLPLTAAEERDRLFSIEKAKREAAAHFHNQYYKGAAICLHFAEELHQGPWEENAVRIEQKEYQTLTSQPIGTSGLGDCIFMVLCQDGKLAGAHIDSTTDPKSIAEFLTKLPPGKVGVRLFGGHNTHTINDIHNRNMILQALNNDPNHQFVLLSSDRRDTPHDKSLAICAYPPRNGGYIFEAAKRVPRSRANTAMNTIVKTFAVNCLAFPLEMNSNEMYLERPIYPELSKIILANLGETALWDRAQPQEKEDRALQPLTAAGSPFIATSLTKFHLENYVPRMFVDDPKGILKQLWCACLPSLIDYMAYLEIADACKKVPRAESGIKDDATKRRTLVDQTEVVEKIARTSAICVYSYGNNSVISSIGIKKIGQDRFTVRVGIPIVTASRCKDDPTFEKRHGYSIQILNQFKPEIDNKDPYATVFQMTLTHAEINLLLKYLPATQQGERYACENFYPEVKKLFELMLVVLARVTQPVMGLATGSIFSTPNHSPEGKEPNKHVSFAPGTK